MRGGKVQLNMGSCGCDPWVEYVGTDDAGDVGQEIYNPSYICSYIAPEPEPIKVRNESHSAYINFWVDRYEILAKYKNNATELAGIIESIAKVDDDEDLTITSITIEGWASPEATEPDETTDLGIEDPGCGSAVSMGIALIAILGTALIMKKRD